MQREEIKQIFDDHLKSLDCLNNDVERAMYLRLIDAAELIVRKCSVPSNGWLNDEQPNDCGCPEEVCKMIKGKCKNPAYR